MNEKLSYYMSLPYCFIVVPDKIDGGFTIYYPDLKGCISCGNTLEEAIGNALDAKKEWLTACIEDNLPIPEPAFQENLNI